VITEIASANWDGLLEAAAIELGHGETLYRVCVTGADFRGPAAAARLLKFHGCALRAIKEEVEYRPLLIARWSQIMEWIGDARFAVMREELVSSALRKRTLMVGMSAQDPNIQQVFVLAGDGCLGTGRTIHHRMSSPRIRLDRLTSHLTDFIQGWVCSQ
jgi:hypothetical protein